MIRDNWIQIEEYRGFTIYFNKEEDKFICDHDAADVQGKKASYSAVKKFVDDFIKENDTFNPVLLQKRERWGGGALQDDRAKLIGVRKDGRFVAEDEKGDKFQIGRYEMDRWVIFNEDNIEIEKEAREIEFQIDSLRKKAEITRKRMKAITLEQYIIKMGLKLPS